MQKDLNKIPGQKVESLSELRQIDVFTEADEVKKKLAELFEVQEAQNFQTYLSDEQSNEQGEIIDKIDWLESWLKEKVSENDDKAYNLEGLLNTAEALKDYKERLDEKFDGFEEIKDRLSRLTNLVDILIVIDRLGRNNQPVEELLPEFISALDQFSIPYDRETLELYFLPVKRADGLRKVIQKASLKVRRSKSRSIELDARKSLLELKRLVDDKVINESDRIGREVHAEVEKIQQDRNEENFEQNVKVLLQFSNNVDGILSKYYQICIPDELFELKDDILKTIIPSGIKQLELNLQSEIGRLSDRTSLVEVVMQKMKHHLGETQFISPRVRTVVNNFLDYIRKELEVSSPKIQEIEQICEDKKLILFLISRPDLLKRNLYEMYRSLKANPAERKKFLKNAIKLIEELTQTQTDAFLAGYDEVWNIFKSSGNNEIKLTSSSIGKIFFKHGYEVGASGEIDFIRALQRARDSHNTILQELSRRFDMTTASDFDIGKELFRSYLRNVHLDSDELPYGQVKLDMTPPITSIRLVCMDVRDYKFASREIDSSDYADKKAVQSTLSGGSSHGVKQTSQFLDGTRSNLPLTVVNGTTSVSYQVTVVEHEDAHQVIIVEQSENKKVASAEKRKTSSLSENFSFDKLHLLTYEQSSAVTNWRGEIKPQLDIAVSRMRDEVQAYLTGGATIELIMDVLSNASPNALYDYVCGTKFRTNNMEAIEKEFADDNNSRDTLIWIFKDDVLKARKAYDDVRKGFIEIVKKLLDLFLADDSEEIAKRKTALIVRHTTPEELKEITKYLRRSEKYKGKRPIETKADTKEQFLKLGVRKQLLALSDEQLDLIMRTAEKEIKIIVENMEKIARIVPRHLLKLVPEVEALKHPTPFTKVGLRTLFGVFDKLLTEHGKGFYWTNAEVQDVKKYDEERTRMNNLMAKDPYLVKGKNPILGLSEAIKAIV